MRVVPSTEPSKSSVRRAGASCRSLCSTIERDRQRNCFTAVLSTPSRVRLTVATSGKRFNPNTRRTIGSSR